MLYLMLECKAYAINTKLTTQPQIPDEHPNTNPKETKFIPR